MTYPTVNVTVDLAELGLPAVAGAIVRAKLDKAEVYGGERVFDEWKATTVDGGTCVVAAFPNALTTATPAGLGTNGSVCTFSITLPGASYGKVTRIKAVVPNQDCDLNDISTDTPAQVTQPQTVAGLVRYDSAQSLTSDQQAQAQANINAADKTAALLGWAYAQAFRLTSATRDANDVVTSASIVWPDGATGTFTADTVSTAFPGAIDAWHATHVVGEVTKTVTQAAVTRNADGAVTAQPAITIT